MQTSKIYHLYSAKEKIRLISEYKKGETITNICKKAGISRTIFYRWIKRFDASVDKETALENMHKKGDQHWRHLPGLNEFILKIVSSHPEHSLSSLLSAIEAEKGNVISRTGLYYILKRYNLTEAESRYAYADAVNTIIGSTVALETKQKEEEPVGIAAENENLASKKENKTFFPIWQRSVFAVCMVLILINSVLILSLNLNAFDLERFIDPFKFTKVKEDGKVPKLELEKPSDQIFIPKHVYHQDLNWGAMAFNTIKSIYKKGEAMTFGFGFIDNLGQTICDADIGLIITDQENKTLGSLNTNSRGVTRSSECGFVSVTNVPDYLATVSADLKEGRYNLRFTTETYNGKRTFDESILITDRVPFEVERKSYPSRIFPNAEYPVEIWINAEKDFVGEIEEEIPHILEISEISSGGIKINKSNNRSVVRWKVNLRKNQVHKLRYTIDFPPTYPAFYEVGPMVFKDNKSAEIVFSEARYWQIVADSLPQIKL